MDKHHYIFTDKKGNLIERCVFIGTFGVDGFEAGKEALKRRAELEKKLGKTVIAWAHMGGDNPPPQD